MAEIEKISFLEQLENRFAQFTQPIAFIGVLGMLAVACITVFDVLWRWIAGGGVTGLTEVVAMVFAVAVAACIPSGVARRVNLKIDVLHHWITGRLEVCMNVVGDGLLCLFFSLLTWRVFTYAASLADQAQTTTLLLWPMAPFMYAVGVMLGIASIIQAVMFMNTLRRSLTFGRKAFEDILRPPVPVQAFLIILIFIVIALAILSITNFPALSQWIVSNTALAIILAFILMWALLLGMIPLAAILGLIGLVGTAAILGFGPALSVLGTEATGFLTNSQVAVLPLFLMMGSFASVAGLAEDIYRLAHIVLGRLRGGLAMATVGACAGFGAVTGSSLAGIATLGPVAIPEMRRRGYSVGLSAGSVAAGGTLSAIVPPSSPLVLFALLTEASMGKLFIAAIVPAVAATLIYVLTIAINVRLIPDAAPAKQVADTTELVAALRRSISVISLFAAVIGGMYLGIFTVTEAASVGAFGAFLFALFRGKLKGGKFWDIMGEVTAVTAMVYSLVFGALMFSFFIIVTAIPDAALQFVGSLNIPPLGLIAIILAIYLIMGCVMDSFSVLVITIPVVTPMIVGMGYDLIWWGIVNLMVVETGLITPPFGLNVYVIKSLTTEDIPMTTVFRGVLPFVIADFVRLGLIVVFPMIVLWLPSTMM